MTGKPVGNKICPICGGHLKEGKWHVPFVLSDKIVVIQGVPGERCHNCGEVLLSRYVVDAVTPFLQQCLENASELVLTTYERISEPVRGK